MPTNPTNPRHTAEELANTLTHGFGLLLSVAGFVILLSLAIVRGNAWCIASCAIYASTLVCLYTTSTLYHSARSHRLKRILLICDHSAIYLLIAGTYTPFLLVNLRGGWGWSWVLLAVIWGMAMAGILFKLWFVEHFPILSTAFYILMGWLALFAIKPMFQFIPARGLLWLLAGGILYCIGVVFYACRKIPFHHAIWHSFVVAGSVCHYIAILFAVILTRHP